jgi:hypothetical protein
MLFPELPRVAVYCTSCILGDLISPYRLLIIEFTQQHPTPGGGNRTGYHLPFFVPARVATQPDSISQSDSKIMRGNICREHRGEN